MQLLHVQGSSQTPSSPTSAVNKQTSRAISLALRSFMIISAVVLPAILSQGAHAHVQSTHVSTTTTTIRPTFQRGLVYPRYLPYAYGPNDQIWQSSLPTMKTQTAAQWLEIPVLFEQATSAGTKVVSGQSTASVTSFAAGIKAAHAKGFRVFLVPLMAVRETGGWAGTINAKNAKSQQAWFDSYWNMFKPYIQAAAANKVEQVSIGTEMQKLELAASPALWNQLIARVRSVYKGPLTYDMNFSSLSQKLPSWVGNRNLAMIGVSAYFQLASNTKRVDPKAMPALWRNIAQKKLDAFGKLIKKPVLISEIGYRNTRDALYQPWAGASKAPIDTQEQSGAFDAALSSLLKDPYISGVFVWGWDDVHQLSIKNQPAIKVISKWYKAS
jgi:Glycoside Hydrolase Family 113